MSALLASFLELDDLHRDALVVLALDGDQPTSRTHWQDCAAQAGLVDDRGKKLHGEGFKAIVDRLASVGAARADARPAYAIADELLVQVLDDAHRRRRLGPIAEGLARGRGYYHSSGLAAHGALLVALASGDAKTLAAAEGTLRSYRAHYGDRARGLVQVLGLHASFTWLARLEPTLRSDYFREVVELAFTGARRIGAGVRESALSVGDEDVRAQIAILSALAGDGERARAALEKCGTAQWTRGAKALLALTEGRHGEARELFAAAGVGSRGQRVDLPGGLAVFDVLLAVTSDRAADVADVARRIHKSKRHLARYPFAAYALECLATYRQVGVKSSFESLSPTTWLDALVVALAQAWIAGESRASRQLVALQARAHSQGYAWIAAELERVANGRQEGSLLPLFGAKAGWELALESLRSALAEPDAPDTGKSRGKKRDAELWWTLTLPADDRWVDVDAYLASKVDVKGAKVSFRRVLEGLDVPVGEQDRRIAEGLIAARNAGSHLLPASVLLPMVGHPRIRDVLERHVTVEAGEPRLRVEPTSNGARIRLVPSRFDESGAAYEREGERVVVYRRTPAAARILAALPQAGLEVPTAGLARMSEVLGALGASIGVDAAASLAGESTSGDPRLHVQLFRAVAGMRVRLRVMPGGSSGPALRPGVPPSETVIHRDGGLERVTRDLEDERVRVEMLLERCPTLASLPREGDDAVARELDTCLELLLELRHAEADVVLEWLEGQPLRVPAERDASHLRVRVKGDASWLTVEGDLRVDEARVLGMRELIECASRARGRFLAIGEGEFLALTDDLRRKVEAIGRVKSLGKDGRVPAALLPVMDGILDGLDVSFGDRVAKKRAALERARDLDIPTPRALQAELRDYQRDGFLFLARRAEAGLGACLADDMGLGKTVQALAVLLHRRDAGPALVVAPTSVCRNWENEAARFAPSLSVHRLRDGNRTDIVAGAKAGDVVLASYGLLASEESLLASRAWGTVIYDEAHALKNASTRRWSAARALRADCSFALTGTPVENHAGELHALFDLLVPGMLGSRGTFDRALGSPIAGGSREAAALLRQLVRPFVLRRTKGQVLSELPPRTDVLQVVPPSAEHAAFYEAVRRRAVEKIEAARKAGGAKAGRARIDLLAEITRLRRAAIDPRLVGGDSAPPGGKLDALAELVSELRAEGRRALVFSQFLEVLDLARDALEARGVECLRLDGTMSEAIRADAVSSFQAGRGDVFLVSLKAGGVGMNLTGAEFVILLDPWWNPAVEDQAAGRAHRIGQSRPVTVARIVTERTIEEKVLALHAKKRRLYEDVVADADGSGTLDVEAIAALLDERADL